VTTTPLAALVAVDLAVLTLLVAFAAWGAWRGTLRQVLGLGLLAAAFPLAARLGPRLESSVVKVVSATGTDVPALAWLVAFVSVVLAGGVVLALLQPLLGRVRPGGRTSAAVFGVLYGAVVLTVLGYSVLIGFDAHDRPRWVEDLERSTSVQGMQVVASTLRDALPVPPWLARRLDLADARIDGAPADDRGVSPRAAPPPRRSRP